MLNSSTNACYHIHSRCSFALQQSPHHIHPTYKEQFHVILLNQPLQQPYELACVRSHLGHVSQIGRQQTRNKTSADINTRNETCAVIQSKLIHLILLYSIITIYENSSIVSAFQAFF